VPNFIKIGTCRKSILPVIDSAWPYMATGSGRNGTVTLQFRPHLAAASAATCLYGRYVSVDFCRRGISFRSAISLVNNSFVVSARCNIYISRLCYDVSVRLSVRLSVTETLWRIIANLGFKFRSHFPAHCGRRAACGRVISRHASQCYRVSCLYFVVVLTSWISTRISTARR